MILVLQSALYGALFSIQSFQRFFLDCGSLLLLSLSLKPPPLSPSWYLLFAEFVMNSLLSKKYVSRSPTRMVTQGWIKITKKSYRPPISPKNVMLSYAMRFYSAVVVSSHILIASIDSLVLTYSCVSPSQYSRVTTSSC